MTSDRPVRVRFAPSPTGNLHVGSARTAIFNWLYARHHRGTFLLRIEDTDQERNRPEFTRSILDGLRWLGMDWDEGPEAGGPVGPYFQSQRMNTYAEAADLLQRRGRAYPCFCSAERLEAMREQQSQAGLQTRYDGCCRNLDPEEAARRMASGEPYLVRLRLAVEPGEMISWTDACKGEISINSDLLDDLVLVKSDGFPTYNFAVVVDDFHMRISDVIRGEDHISNTPKQILIYRALGLELPRFGHIPMILGTDRSKMSKRHGATSVIEYQNQGYLPEAFLNFLALLGWSSPDDRELFSREELVSLFDLDRVSSHGAIFDMAKLKWMNQQYIKALSGESLLPLCRPFLDPVPGFPGEYSAEELAEMAGLFRERLEVLSDITQKVPYFFADPAGYDEKGLKNCLKTPDLEGLLQELIASLEALPEFSHEAIESVVRRMAEDRRLGAGKIIHPTRLGVSGRTDGPGLFELMKILGKEACLRRLRAFLAARPWTAGAPA